MLIVNPGIHISTAWAFSQLQPQQPSSSLKEIIKQPVHEWRDELKNDFEIPVFAHHPEIKKIKDDMYTNGAAYASMSGSGSTVFGLFKDEVSINFPKKYFSRSFYPGRALQKPSLEYHREPQMLHSEPQRNAQTLSK